MATNITESLIKSNEINIAFGFDEISLEDALDKYKKLFVTATEEEMVGLRIGIDSLEYIARIQEKGEKLSVNRQRENKT